MRFFPLFQVTDTDPLPHTICPKCSEQLETLYCFKELAKKAEHLLNEFLACAKKFKGTPEVKTQLHEKYLY